ncbi:hypothetical protein M9H77_06892 [Catharanthus roseus]|uniref:Uncharacterized protein n=1 Tax=Catharanthus roseus TaxID=4058 RepID=A0ACC0BTP0_CATRO|nr:hypothetical protein M9H77_06892 [Catharanthus roseus]
MSQLVAKRPEASFLPINKGLPKVEKSFKRRSRWRQVKSSRQKLFSNDLLQRSSSEFKHFLEVFIVFFILEIEESSSGFVIIIHQQSPFDLTTSYEALKLTPS